jgi:rubrerythrin
MNLMKVQLKWASRIENIAGAYYGSLSRRYRKREDLSKTLDLFSRDEYRHGALFRKGYRDEFGKNLAVKPWITLGKCLAVSQILIPLRWKLKTAGGIESLALGLMNRELESENPNRYRQILETIKPDEERHAALYRIMYP